MPQIPFVKARFGSARCAWDRASDTCAFGGTRNIWLIEDEKDKGGKLVGMQLVTAWWPVTTRAAVRPLPCTASPVTHSPKHAPSAAAGLRVGGGLRASAVVSDVSRVVDGRRDPGDATSFHFAYTLDCQAYMKPTGGSERRLAVRGAGAEPVALRRWRERTPAGGACLTFGSWPFNPDLRPASSAALLSPSCR